MPLFGRSTRKGSRRQTNHTDTTVTDGGYNNAGYNNTGHNNLGHNNLGHNNGGYDDSVDNGRHSHEMSHRKGRLGGRGSKPGREKAHKQKRPLFDIHSGHYNRRPSFGTWLKHTWLDILTMVIMGAIGLGVYEANPAPSRSFPITFIDGTIVYPQFAYPLRKEIIPIWAAAMLGALVPIFVFLCMQIRIRSFWDLNNAIIGLLYSLIGAAVFQVFVKWLIGGLRPHFLDVCAPDLTRVAAEGGNGFRNIMFTPDICTGDRNQINDSLESMPSGHSTAAWAGFLYLYFYLNAKLKVFSNHHPAMWKLIALYAPLLGATLITGALTIDEFHNWYDCLAGAVIGSVFAISAYRMVYASVWDFRFNHIPLTRHTPFSYGAGPAGAGGFETCVFTRKGGWGHEEAYGGAPFDSAFGLRGQGGAGNAVVGNEHTVGLGHKNMGHRHGDVEHNAVGVGHNQHGHGNGLTKGIGHHNNDQDYNTHGHNTLGHNTAGHNTIGNNTLGHNTVGQNTIGSNTLGHNTVGQNTVGSNALGHNTVGHNTLGHNSVGHNTLGHNNHNTIGHNTLGHNNVGHETVGHNNTLGHNNQGYNNYETTHDNVTEPGMMHHSDMDREGRPATIGDNRYKSHRKSLERKALAQQARNEGTY